MPLSTTWFLDRLKKKASKGPRGYPVATVAFYGPDATFASKVAVGILARDGAEPDPLERYYSSQVDVRKNPEVLKTVLALLEQHQVKTVVMVDRIFGCPHEEGIDYAEGQSCPRCLYWHGRNRFTGLSEDSDEVGKPIA
jgi:hypothetical protein